MKNTFIMSLIASALLVSCNQVKKENLDVAATPAEQTAESQPVESKSTEVPFVIANGYFVNNTQKNTKVEELKITSKQQLDQYFGMAATMGEKEQPTTIDFNKSYVLAVVGVESNKETTFDVKGLVQSDNGIELSYTIKEDSKAQSFTTHSFVMLVVDKQFDKEVKFKKE